MEQYVKATKEQFEHSVYETNGIANDRRAATYHTVRMLEVAQDMVARRTRTAIYRMKQ